MEIIAPDRTLVIEGLPWAAIGDTKQISIGSFQSKMLCTNHNSALSDLDTLAGRFFGAFPHVARGNRAPSQFHLFVGADFERWMAKALIGGICAGVLSNQHGSTMRDWEPPSDWLDFVYHGAKLPPRAGLYYCKPLLGEFEVRSTARVATICAEDGSVYGLEIFLHEYCFLLIMCPERIPTAPGTLANATHRPTRLAIIEPERNTTFLFDWGDEPRGGSVLSTRLPDNATA